MVLAALSVRWPVRRRHFRKRLTERIYSALFGIIPSAQPPRNITACRVAASSIYPGTTRS